MPWRVRWTFVSWANSFVGAQSCPTPPGRSAGRADPTRPWYVRVLDSTGSGSVVCDRRSIIVALHPFVNRYSNWLLHSLIGYTLYLFVLPQRRAGLFIFVWDIPVGGRSLNALFAPISLRLASTDPSLRCLCSPWLTSLQLDRIAWSRLDPPGRALSHLVPPVGCPSFGFDKCIIFFVRSLYA